MVCGNVFSLYSMCIYIYILVYTSVNCVVHCIINSNTARLSLFQYFALLLGAVARIQVAQWLLRKSPTLSVLSDCRET